MRWDQARVLLFDTETTGVDVADDRIVELGAAWFESGRPASLRRALVHPGRPIPPEASAIHGITDDTVRDAPPFAEVAPRFVTHLDGSASGGAPPWLAGYNALGYDVPILNAELARAGLQYRIDPARVLDLLLFVRWHHRGERGRKLGEMCARYGVRLDAAHSACADAAACGHLLFRMVEAGVIPADVDAAFAAQARFAPRLDDEWRRWSYWLYEDRDDGGVRLGAGKHCGVPLEAADPGYLAYLLDSVSDLPGAVRDAFAARARPATTKAR